MSDSDLSVICPSCGGAVCPECGSNRITLENEFEWGTKTYGGMKYRTVDKISRRWCICHACHAKTDVTAAVEKLLSKEATE